MRSRSYLFLVLVLGLALLSGVGYYFKKYTYGLDVRGGIRLIYQMQLDTPEQRRESQSIGDRMVPILVDRSAGPLGVTEPVVQRKGLDEFIVELPGATDLGKAREALGTSARIEFYWAKNVNNPKVNYRPYDVSPRDADPDKPQVAFVRRSDGKQITFGDPEYQQILNGWDLILSGEDLKSARATPHGNSSVPSMEFSGSGAAKMEKWSRAHYNQREQIAAVMDKHVLSIAAVNDGTVLSDNAEIIGTFTSGYVSNLVELLNGGALPVDLKLLSSEKVDPTIGQAALDKIVVAGAIAFALVSLFLIVYYALPGFVAFVALSLYVLFTLTALKWMNATFSLASIAGFILSVGMAVDANILVFERFKEEMKAGKGLKSAIELGFRRALPSIIDSNACTILTSLVLVSLGTGPVKGFATTLIIGVGISLFTAVAVTRSLLMFSIGSGLATNEKLFAVRRNWFGEKFEERADTDPMKVVQSSRRWFMISLATIIPGLIFIGLGGIRPNVEFRGGYELQYPVSANESTTSLTNKLESANLKGGNVKLAQVGNKRVAYITLPPLAAFVDPATKQDRTEGEVAKIVSQATGLPGDTGITKIGPTVQKETLRNAIWGVIISSALIIVYLAIRFGIALGGFKSGLKFGFSAIGALVHDILVVIGMAAIFGFALGWEVSALSITAMLTMIGFSVHDTVVIFDRIRENLRRPHAGEDFGHLVNRSISRSFARSINTSMTVVATLAILAAFGTPTPDLKFFVVTMLVGIVSGTYSSIYNASPILYLWDRSVMKKQGDDQSLVAIASREAAASRVISTRVGAPEPGVPTAADTPGARSYGQVRRRANTVSKSHIELDD